MKLQLLLIFSICFLATATAQTDSTAQIATDTVIAVLPIDSIKSDSAALPKRFLETQIVLDYGKLATTAIGLDTRFEGGISLVFFERFSAVAEYGIATLSPERTYKNGTYESSGSYYRFGGGITGKIDQKSSIGLGVRYAFSSFDESGTFELASETGLQENYIIHLDRKNMEARWWSLVLTSERYIQLNKDDQNAAINKRFKLGFYARLRFLVAYDKVSDPVEVYSIPGYGAAINKQQLAANLFLKIIL